MSEGEGERRLNINQAIMRDCDCRRRTQRIFSFVNAEKSDSERARVSEIGRGTRIQMRKSAGNERRAAMMCK